MKNETKSFVVVPELAGMELGRCSYWGHMAVITSVTHWPPITVLAVLKTDMEGSSYQSMPGHRTR